MFRDGDVMDFGGKVNRSASLEELAERTAAGDLEAFGGIYEILLDPLYRYFYWNLSSTEEAEDLTEEVFLRCLLHISDFNARKASFKAWAFRIAHNLLVDHFRKGKGRGSETLEAEREADQPPLGEALEEEERRKAVREALGELPSSQRQLVVMKYFAGMSNAEVARALGKSEGAVNALQHRALRRLGGILEKRGWV